MGCAEEEGGADAVVGVDVGGRDCHGCCMCMRM